MENNENIKSIDMADVDELLCSLSIDDLRAICNRAFVNSYEIIEDKKDCFTQPEFGKLCTLLRLFQFMIQHTL